MEATRLMGQPGADINPTLFLNDKWQSFYIDFLRPGSGKNINWIIVFLLLRN